MPATNDSDPTRLAAACDAVFTLDAPALVGLVRAADSWDVRHGPTFYVPEDLIGFVGPLDWDAVAVVTTGTARHMDGAHEPLRARITYALDRADRYASSITTIEGTTRVGATGGPVVGHLADVCHRILGLPTETEPSTPMDLLAASWLSDVLGAHDEWGDGFPLDDWDGLASLSPFDDRAADRPTWADVHAALVGDGRGWGDFSLEDVKWMDPPTLARFMLASRPPLGLLFDELAQEVAPPVLRRVLAVLDDVGIDVTQLAEQIPLSRGRARR